MHPTSSLLRRGGWLVSVAAVAALAGCASGPSTYTASVQSYASMAGVPLPTTYRLELLPSQIQHQQNFAVIANAAQQALDSVGLQKAANPTQAHLVAQIDAISVVNPSTSSYDPALYGPPGVYGWGYGQPWAPGPWGSGPWGGWGMDSGWGMTASFPVYHRSVNIVLRNAKTQSIVYETSAQYNDMQTRDPQIWRVLFGAALNDFPNPPQGVRQVDTTLLPAASAPTAPAPAATRQ